MTYAAAPRSKHFAAPEFRRILPGAAVFSVTRTLLQNFAHDRADLLDVELDEQPGDDIGRRSFIDDVRSDSYDDERHERR